MELSILQFLFDKFGYALFGLAMIFIFLGKFAPDLLSKVSQVLPFLSPMEKAEVKKMEAETTKNSIEIIQSLATELGDILTNSISKQREDGNTITKLSIQVQQMQATLDSHDINCDYKIRVAISESEKHCEKKIEDLRKKIDTQLQT